MVAPSASASFLHANLTAATGVEHSFFGSNLASGGESLQNNNYNPTVIAVGAPNLSGNEGTSEGKLYVYHTDDNWATSTELAISASDVSAGGQFGYSPSLSAGGHTVAVGSPGRASSTGAVYVVNSADSWATSTEKPIITASDAQTGDKFGYAVELSYQMSGYFMVVGAPEATRNSLSRSGAAYIFSTSDNWETKTEVQKLIPSDAEEDDLFGYSVSMDAFGSVVAIGASGAYNGKRGKVYIFTTSNSWASATETILNVGSVHNSANVGLSVSLMGGVLAVGAPEDRDGSSVQTGSVIILTSVDNWASVSVTHKQYASDGSANQRLGSSVSLGNSYPVTVAAAASDAVYLFAGDSNTEWTSVIEKKIASVASEAPVAHLSYRSTVLLMGRPGYTDGVTNNRGAVNIEGGCAYGELIDWAAGSCGTCPTGQTCEAGSMSGRFCRTGRYCPGGNQEESCPVGTHNNQTGATAVTDCRTCPAGTYCDERSTNPTNCRSGTANPFPGSGIGNCSACAAGTYCPAGSVTPITCPKGGYCVAETFAASPCSAGTYSNVTGATSAATCQTCPAGTSCGSRSALPTPCEAGYYNGAEAASSCTICPRGSYCPGTGTVSPTMCAAGTWNPDFGADEASDCRSCSPGMYCTEGAIARTPCPAGTFSGATDADSEDDCAQCGAGKYCPEGSPDETDCAGGTFSASVGATAASVCQACAAGTYCPAGSAAATECPVGSYCPASSDSTTACPSGTFNDETGATASSACETCPAGYYCDTNVEATPCPGGTYRETSGASALAECAQCPAGSFCPEASDETTTCTLGYYCPAGSTDPQDCPSGTATETQGADESSDCVTCDGACETGDPTSAGSLTTPPVLSVYVAIVALLVALCA